MEPHIMHVIQDGVKRVVLSNDTDALVMNTYYFTFFNAHGMHDLLQEWQTLHSLFHYM